MNSKNFKHSKPAENYVDLLSLKSVKLLQNKNLEVILQDDIWDNDTLLLRSGRYLTESLINKLLNFGIKHVNVDFIERESQIAEYAEPLNDFATNQCVLIIENNIINASWLVRHLVDVGFSHKNIFITADYNAINHYFRIKKMDFIFTNLSIYEKCTKCIDKYSRLKNLHAFVSADNINSMRKIRTENNTAVKFFKRTQNAEDFKNSLKQALNSNYRDSSSEEALAS